MNASPVHDRGRRRYFALFIGLFLLTQWPFAQWASLVHLPLGGVPFLALYLTAVYAALIGLLIAAARRNL